MSSIASQIRQLEEERDRMRAELLAVALQFEFYAAHHLAKQPPDHVKAKINREWADRCRVAAEPWVFIPYRSGESKGCR